MVDSFFQQKENKLWGWVVPITYPIYERTPLLFRLLFFVLYLEFRLFLKLFHFPNLDTTQFLLNCMNFLKWTKTFIIFCYSLRTRVLLKIIWNSLNLYHIEFDIVKYDDKF